MVLLHPFQSLKALTANIVIPWKRATTTIQGILFSFFHKRKKDIQVW